MDSIRIEQMVFYGYHGVFPEESKLGQRFHLDIELFLNLSDAAGSDSVEDTIDYGEVYEVVRRVVEGTPRKLIESVAGAVCTEVFSAFERVERVVVTIAKPSAPVPGIFGTVSATIDRTRHSSPDARR